MSEALKAFWLRTFNESYMAELSYERALIMWFIAHDPQWQGPLWPPHVMSLVDALVDWAEKVRGT